ncbi:MAG: glutathione S-transferase family protein [Phormidesmis sp.]
MANITLYGTPVSTYVRTVRLLLDSAGIEYDLKDIGIFNGDNKTDDYLSKHPFGKVPACEIEGQQIYETDAITYYVNEALAAGKFKPTDLFLQARMHQIMAVINSYLYAPAISALTIENLIVPQQGGEPDKKKIEDAIAPAKQALDALEDLISGSPYLLGSEISLADFYLIPIFVYIYKTPQFEAITAEAPKLKNWWEKAQTLDVVKAVCG